MPGRAASLSPTRARALFKVPPAPFRPHVSLVYGRLDAARRDTLQAALRPKVPAGINARHLDLIRTDGTPDAWRRLGRFDLGAVPR